MVAVPNALHMIHSPAAPSDQASWPDGEAGLRPLVGTLYIGAMYSISALGLKDDITYLHVLLGS